MNTLDQYLRTGRRLCKSGRLTEAQAAFHAALQISPGSLDVLNGLGAIEIQQGRYPQAYKILLTAYRLAPENPVTVKNFGKALEGIEKFNEAEALYRYFLNTSFDEGVSAQLVRCLEKTTATRQPVPLQPIDRINRQVVFISDHPRSREIKIAAGLRQNGWDTVLLHRHMLARGSKALFTASRRYASPEEALELAHDYQPTLYHVFSNWDFEVAAKVMRQKPGKIVFDDYDVMTGMVNVDIVRRSDPCQLELELFCLKNANGICCRSLETQYAFRHYNIFKNARRIYFPDYMWGTLLSEKNVMTDGPLKENTLVYCGSYPDIDPCNPENNWISRIAAAFQSIGFKLHLYPTANCDPDYQRHFNEPNLVFHRHRDPVALIHEMSQYTAGIQVPNRMYRMTMRYGDEKKRYSTSGKIFDYLDARLPICIEDQRFQVWLLNRYGVAVHLVKDLLKTSDYEKANRNLKAKKVMIDSCFSQISEKLSMSRQIHRLIEFYEKVVQEE